MLFGSGAIRKEIETQGRIISNELNEIKDNIPYQSELERENNKLLDSNVKLKEQVETLSNTLLSLQETNEKLLKYIADIEEVKNAGGIKCDYFDEKNSFKLVRYERKKIPSIEIYKVVSEYE